MIICRKIVRYIMNKYLINYASSGYFNAQIKNTKTALQTGGFDKCINYGFNDLSESFKSKHKQHLSKKRGAGYWIWKPYIILDALKKIDNNDILMYSDSGCHFIRSMSVIFDRLEETKNKVLVFNLAHTEKDWNKRDCFIRLNCDSPEYTDTKQIMGTFFLCKKNDFAIQLVEKWSDVLSDFHMIADESISPSKVKNYDSFKEHRHDQSILSLVCKINKVDTMEDITEWGSEEIRKTEHIIAHTRKSD